MIKVGDIVQAYAYGQVCWTGEVLRVSMGEAEVMIGLFDVVWTNCDNLFKIG